MSAITSSEAATRREGPGLEGLFARCAGEGRAALIPYVTAGFPDSGTTAELLRALPDAGADVVELGIPFSDPLADGPTIQRTSFRALEGGMTVPKVLRLLEAFRAGSETPVVLFTYLNPVLRYGVEDFVADAAAAGADGVLVTDLPVGADRGVEEAAPRAGLDLIRLVAPTSSEERIRAIARSASGFLYYISRTGVTGARTEIRDELSDEVRRLRELVELPVAVGFGISRPEHAAAVGAVADGVVVGSALLDRLEEEGVRGAAAFVGELRGALADGPS